MAINADDTTLYAFASTADQLSNILNWELNAVVHWIQDNKLKINPEKTKCMLLGSQYKLKTIPKLHLTLGATVVPQVEEFKLLGATVDSKMTWGSHMTQVLQSMGRSTGMIRHCRKCIPQWLTID